MPDGSAPVPATSRRRIALHVLVPLGVIAAVWLLRDTLAPIVAAMFLAYVLSPLVDRLERRRVPRSVGSALVLAMLFGLLAGILVGLLPVVLAEFHRFVERLPDLLDRLAREKFPEIERTLGIDLPDDLGGLLSDMASRLRAFAPQALGPVAELLARVFTGALGFVTTLVSVLLVPILTYFFMRDFPTIVAAVRKEIPARLKPGVESYAAEVDGIMSAYLRGQLVVVLCLAAIYAAGLWIVGLRLGVAIGVVAGLLAFIPYAGFVVGIGLAMLMALVTFEGAWTYAGIATVFAAGQTAEGLVLTPVLVGRRVGLSTVWVLVAILVFGALLGFVGVLLAVPLGAVFRVSARRLLAFRREIDGEAGGGGEGAAAAPAPAPADPAVGGGTAAPAGDATGGEGR